MLILILKILVELLLLYDNKEGIKFTLPDLVNTYSNYGIVINKDNKTLQKNDKVITYKNTCNSNNGIKNSLNKYTTSSILKSQGVPVPEFYLYDKNNSIEYNLNILFSKLKYPLVVKPTKGTYGSYVKTNINSDNELKDHIRLLLKKRKDDIIIEKYHIGKEYRILVIKNEIVDVVQRDKPRVIGDGKSNLKKLIEEHKYNHHKIHNINLELIESQKYSLDSIIPENEIVYVSSVNNYHNGASIKQISLDNIHPINMVLFSRINNMMEMNINGIDFISSDLSKPYYQDGVIIECNGGPDLEIHYEATNNKKDLIDRFVFLLQNLFL